MNIRSARQRLSAIKESLIGERGAASTQSKESPTIDITISMDGREKDSFSLYFVEEGNRQGVLKDLVKALRDAAEGFED